MAEQNLARIFGSYTLPNGTEIKNRCFMAPMTTCSGYHDGSVPTELIDYYAERAGEIGVILVECAFVDDRGCAFPGALGVDKDTKIEGLSKIAKAIQAKGSKAVLQIYHGGRMIDPKLIGGRQPICPSPIPAPRPNMPIPEGMTAKDVTDMIQKFGDAVRRACLAGFDGVEIHGANTYLIQQFFSENSNQRDDEWGGSRENRIKFPLAVLDITQKMVKQYADDSFIIGYRFSPEEMEVPGIRLDDTMYLLEELAKRGVDYLHISMGHYLRPSICNRSDKTPTIKYICQHRSKTLAQVPLIGVGCILNYSDVVSALDAGYDLVCIGRGMIAYPDWVRNIKYGVKMEYKIDSTRREQLKIPEPLWHFSLVEQMIVDTSLGDAKFKPGVFKQKVMDDDVELTLNITLETDSIKDIELVSGKYENPDFNVSYEEIRKRILEANSPHVDAVSGATTQSVAVEKAVAKAIAQSVKERQAEEGGTNEPKFYDVVVIGTGGAGLSAAIQAHDEGANVLLIEKMSSIGGNTIKSSAGMNAAETRYQRVKHIKDSKELFFEETMKGGKNLNNPDLLRRFVENAPQAVEWLATRGIMLNDLTFTGGMSVERCHRPRDGSAVGGYLISGLVRNINKREIEVLLDTRVTKINYERNSVRSVECVNEDGEKTIIRTNNVIVATGGFSANSDMVCQYQPQLKGFVTTNHKGATGDGIKLLTDLGAGTVDMQQIQIHPTVEQTTSYLISESIRGGGAILVSQAGNRFFNELETRDKVSAAIIALPEHYSYIVFDEHVHEKNKAVDEYLRANLVTQADTAEELAQKLKIDPATFAKTLEKYNGFVEKQHDDDFGRTTGLRAPINKGPFYAIRIAPGVHHTMGGVTINTSTQVLDKDHKIIAGAYAAGEVVGGIHGGNRIGGNAVADIIIFGTLAGHMAATRARDEPR